MLLLKILYNLLKFTFKLYPHNKLVLQYKNICNCKQKEKGQKLFDCNNQYTNTINNLDQNTIDLLLSTTDDKTMEFYDNHNHIRTISLLS